MAMLITNGRLVLGDVFIDQALRPWTRKEVLLIIRIFQGFLLSRMVVHIHRNARGRARCTIIQGVEGGGRAVDEDKPGRPG